MARAKLMQEIVEARYPLYDAEMRAQIADLYAKHRGEPAVEDRIVEAIWQEHSGFFRTSNIDASRAEGNNLAAAKRGELTSAGRVAIRRYLDEARFYDESLCDLTDEALVTRYDEVCGAAQAVAAARKRERGLRADKLAFFSRANATADYAHWCALPVWSAEEATALSLDKDPRRVNVVSLREYKCVHGSPFRDEFMARLDGVERAIKAEHLRAPLTPTAFLKWAVRRNIDVPVPLSQTLVTSSPTLPGSNASAEIHSNRLHTYYTIILGLAAKHYELDVTLGATAKRPRVYNAIMKDLLSVSAEVDVKTLRKIVREALTWARNPKQPIVERAERKKEARERAGVRPQKGK